MRKKFILILFFLFSLINQITAECDDGQININSATLEELDQLYGIGPAKAQAIIDSRPFENLNDLINVNGIGNKTLEGILLQDLACIGEETIEDNKKEEIKENKEVGIDDNESQQNNLPNSENLINDRIKEKNKPAITELIRLAPQSIKSNENSVDGNQDKILTLMVLMLFGLIIGFLIIIRKNRYNKNEFR